MKVGIIRGYLTGVVLLSVAIALGWVTAPADVFDTPYSVVVEDRDGRLLAARIATDEQWRFPEPDSLPDRFVEALITFEDQRFFSHNGVDPIALLRALWQNVTAGKIESGGSTLSMQVIRLSRGQRARTVWEKGLEILGAWRMEASHSKEEILRLYAAHAPFGGNVVGLEAAAWRYCQKPPERLSWAEATCLAVLPNAPALLHPGRNQGPLLAKRNRLLKRLRVSDHLSELECRLSEAEPLPGKPNPLPQLTYHLMGTLGQTQPQQYRFSTTIDRSLQEQVNAIAARHHQRMAAQEIYNMAIVVAAVQNGAVRAYVGNVLQPDLTHESAVDVMQAPRSSGSILKPFLFAHAIEDGQCVPSQLIPDIPVYYGSFTPENYNHRFDGAVPVSDALARSLNVPAVLLLQQYGVARLKSKLEAMGMHTLFRPAEAYGLSLILGGAEVCLWDVVGMYVGMANTLRTFLSDGTYPMHPYDGLTVQSIDRSLPNTESTDLLSAGSIYAVFEMLKQVKRPEEEKAWEHFSSGQHLAWKTGTSYGHRDAWAVGITPSFAVGVWVGNADGEGRPGLTGTDAAAPVLFDVMTALPRENWFAPPEDDRITLPMCRESGYRKGRYCPVVDSVAWPLASVQAPACPYHRLVYVNTDGHQVHADCFPIQEAILDTIFALPPHIAAYFHQRHAGYDGVPPWAKSCQAADEQTMRLVYPQPGAHLYLPRDVSGQQQPAVLEAVHVRPDARLYWHLNERYLGETVTFHQMPVHPNEGIHHLTLVDDRGQRWESTFKIKRSN